MMPAVTHPPRVRLLTSPAPHVLEASLVARVRAALERSPGDVGPAARVVIVVPTLMLAERVQRVLAAAAGDAGVVAGAEIVHHRRLATRLLDLAFVHGLRETPPPRLLGSLEIDALVRASIASLPEGSALRRLADDRPRMSVALGRTFGELREALVTTAALRDALGARDPIVVAHATYVSLLDRVERDHGATDQAGHALAAAAAARALADRLGWDALFHHGSHELVGSQAELLRAVSEQVATTVLAPGGDAPVHEASRRALARWPGVPAEALDGESLLDVDALFDESRTSMRGETHRPVRIPPAAGFARIEAVHVRGIRAELEVAARLAAEAHLDRGVPLEDIAVVARSLDPFGGHVEAVFDAHSVPFTTTATAPLLREPWAQAAATLLAVLTEDLPRAAVIELLRSPWTRLDDKVADTDACTPDLWDEWTLSAGVVRGAPAFTEDVLAWHRADLAERAQRRGVPLEVVAREAWVDARARRIGALAGLAGSLVAEIPVWAACRSPSQHAVFLRQLTERWLHPPDSRGEFPGAVRARDAVLAALDQLACLSDLPAGAAPRALDPRAARVLVADVLASTSLPLGSRDGSGVRVLAAMPARCVPFRDVILVGLNQGSFPRRPRQDPFLRDPVREKLRAAAPSLAVKSEGRAEERQILALALAAASDRVTVTWQRADDDGKARAPSLYLREIARLAIGRPHLESLTDRKDDDLLAHERLPLMALPAHPSEAARMLRERTGRASFRDAALEASQRVQRRRAVEALARGAGRLDDDLASGLATTRLIDSFELDPDDARRSLQLAHDGVIGPGRVARPARLSATSLETLGSCALRWCFERALGIEALDEESEEGAVGASEMGSLVHGTLEDLGRAAMAQGTNAAWLGSTAATDALSAAWTRRLSQFAGSRRGHAPVAWDALSRRWLDALVRFVAADAARLLAGGARIVAVEHELEADVPVDAPQGRIHLRLHGRVDRIVETPDGWQVEDYKTKRDVSGFVDKASVLKGRRLQGLAYLLLAREWARDRAHSRLPAGAAPFVSAAFLPVHPDAPSFAPSELTVAEEQPASWSETLSVLDRVLEGGAFGFKVGTCDWCAARLACRRNHVPTQERQRLVPELMDYLDLSGKSTRSVSLEDVRARAARRDAGDGDGAPS